MILLGDFKARVRKGSINMVGMEEVEDYLELEVWCCCPSLLITVYGPGSLGSSCRRCTLSEIPELRDQFGWNYDVEDRTVVNK